MAKEVGLHTSITPTATADSATVLADATYPFGLQGVAAQKNTIFEIYEGGQATSSTPTFMLLAFNVVAGATLTKGTGLTQAFMDSSATALGAPAVIYNTTGTDPQRSTTRKVLNLSFNAFGGIVRWVAAPGEEIMMYGASLNLGDISFSATTGGAPGLMGAHIIFEST